MSDVSTPRHAASLPSAKREAVAFHALQEQCRQLCLSLFIDPRTQVRSVGCTSAIGGEGKTFVATMLATSLANDTDQGVVLAECNWKHPTLHQWFGIPATPGIAEWQRGECAEGDMCHQVSDNLVVLPAGDGQRDAVKLLRRFRQEPLRNLLGGSREFLIIDLPPITTTAYGVLAASLVETLLLVVHAGVTPQGAVTDTCSRLNGLPVQGLILNQIESRIPRWLREIL